MGEKFREAVWTEYRAILKARGDGRELLRRSLKRARSKIDKLDVLHLLAHECTEQGDLAGAEETHRRSIELDPKSPAAWTALGRFYLRYKNDGEPALRCIESALARATELKQLVLYVHNDRLYLATALGRIDLAEDSLQKIRDYPSEAEVEPWELEICLVSGLRRLGVRADLLDAFIARIGTPPPSCRTD